MECGSRGVRELLAAIVSHTLVNLPFPAAASFVLGKEHVVHKAEINPPRVQPAVHGICPLPCAQRAFESGHFSPSSFSSFFFNMDII